jgi:hypothetical protein
VGAGPSGSASPGHRSSDFDAARPSGAAGLIEVELGDGLGRVEGGRLVEVVGGEGFHRSDVIGVKLGCGLGRSAGGGKSGRGVREVEASEDGADGHGAVRKARLRMSDPQSGQRRGNTHRCGRGGGPSGSGGAGEGGCGVVVGVYGCPVGKSGRRLFGLRRAGVVAAEGDDPARSHAWGDRYLAARLCPGPPYEIQPS